MSETCVISELLENRTPSNLNSGFGGTLTQIRLRIDSSHHHFFGCVPIRCPIAGSETSSKPVPSHLPP